MGIVHLAFDAEDLCLRYGHMIEQRLACHAVVTVGVIGRNGAFVAEIDVHTIPSNALGEFWIGQSSIQRARRGAAGERNVKLAA